MTSAASRSASVDPGRRNSSDCAGDGPGTGEHWRRTFTVIYANVCPELLATLPAVLADYRSFEDVQDTPAEFNFTLKVIDKYHQAGKK